MASGSAVTARKARATSTIASMPWPQLEPSRSAPAASSARAACSIETPMIVKNPRGVRSKVSVAITGISGDTARAASTASRASCRSVMVSMQTRSAPASTWARICCSKAARTCSGWVSPSGARRRAEGPTEADT